MIELLKEPLVYLAAAAALYGFAFMRFGLAIHEMKNVKDDPYADG